MARTRTVKFQPDQACPLCRDPLAGPETIGVCPGCETLYHHACARELGGCATLGCAKRATGKAPPPTRSEPVAQPSVTPLGDRDVELQSSAEDAALLVLTALLLFVLLIVMMVTFVSAPRFAPHVFAGCAVTAIAAYLVHRWRTSPPAPPPPPAAPTPPGGDIELDLEELWD